MEPRKYAIEKCIRSCSLNSQKLPGRLGELTHQWYEEGDTNFTIIKKAAVLGVKLSHGGVARHRRNHLIPLDQVEDISLGPHAGSNGHKVTDLEVIERIIASGAGQLAVRGIKISPEMTLRAIEMKFKLTQGSAFEGFLSAIGAVNEEAVKDEEFTEAREARDAVLGKDEQEQVGADVAESGKQRVADQVAIAWRAMRRDPVVFAQTLLPKQPHRGQVEWLHGAKESINVLVPGNRWGKSTVIAMKHIWHCMFKIGGRPDSKHTWMTMPYETISAAHAADQAEIVFGEARSLLQHPAIAPFVARTYSTPFPRIVFYNGAVFHCRSAHDGGKYLDGHSYRYVSVDEAGWIDHLKNLVNGVILMRLAGGGSLDLIGTPKGYGDLYWYANRGLRGVEGYYTQRGSAFDNPYLPAADMKRRDELLKHGDPRLREQVLYGEFVSLEGLAFTKDQLENAFDPGLPAHVDYHPDHRYAQAWDLGRRTDYTVGMTLDVTMRPFRLVDFQRLNKVPWETIYTLIGQKAKEYNVYQPIIDATGPQGDVLEEELVKRGVFVNPVKISTGAQKVNLINTLQSALDFGRKQIGQRLMLDEAMIEHYVPDLEPAGVGNWGLLRLPPIPALVDEMGVYQLDDKDLVQDCVMALALVMQSVYDGILLSGPVLGSIYDPLETKPAERVPLYHTSSQVAELAAAGMIELPD